MKKTIAVRNLRLCTKDCLCLYVCPTGASDTENSVIDTAKCVGCGTCAAACPSGAISMVPVEYPPQQKKAGAVLAPAYALANAKARQEQAARQLAAAAESDGLYRLLTAMTRSVRLVQEDLLRGVGLYAAPERQRPRPAAGLGGQPAQPGLPHRGRPPPAGAAAQQRRPRLTTERPPPFRTARRGGGFVRNNNAGAGFRQPPQRDPIFRDAKVLLFWCDQQQKEHWLGIPFCRHMKRVEHYRTNKLSLNLPVPYINADHGAVCIVISTFGLKFTDG